MKLSKCCQATVVVEGGEEGTNHYQCTNCLKACDLYVVVKKPVKGAKNLTVHCVMCGKPLHYSLESMSLYCANPACPNYGLAQIGIERMPDVERPGEDRPLKKTP